MTSVERDAQCLDACEPTCTPLQRAFLFFLFAKRAKPAIHQSTSAVQRAPRSTAWRGCVTHHQFILY